MDTIARAIELQELRSENELIHLVQNASAPCVSIYMPLHEIGTNVQQDAIRLNDLLRDAHHLLIERGLNAAAAEDLLKPA